MIASEARRVYRSKEQGVVIVIIALSASTAIVAPWFATPRHSWVGRAASIVFAGAFAFFSLFRCARAGVFIEEKGIRILNPLSSARLPWTEIERFSIEPYGVFPQMGQAELSKGETVHIWGIQAPNRLLRPRSRGAQDLIEALNEVLAHGKRAGMADAR
jgi:hypothetical protein